MIDLLLAYGFKHTKTLANGELMLEKTFANEPLPVVSADVFGFDRAHYPRFFDGSGVRKFCVPIRPGYHRRLFPEIAFIAELPLFPSSSFSSMLAHGSASTPGNTIRKVYLCRAKITRLRPGDLVFFYMSKDEAYSSSQSITTVGVVEQVAKCYICGGTHKANGETIGFLRGGPDRHGAVAGIAGEDDRLPLSRP
ncbi:MAG TPA: hypothetical protein VMU69_29445 [Bradyrhizobium sp.]|nr:hypothetical protein [Bradyrhizobium sp.]